MKNTTLDIKKGLELYKFLNTKRYSLKEIGISNKNVLDWSRAGLFIDEKPAKGRRTYNMIEYVWIKLIEQLRSFGLSIDAIRNVKETLLMDNGVKELLSSMVLDSYPKELEEDKAFMELKNYINSQISKEEISEMMTYFDSKEMRMTQTSIAGMIYSAFYDRLDFHLLVNSTGSLMISEAIPDYTNSPFDYIMDTPYICIPLRTILSKFLTKEELKTQKEDEQINLSDSERSVIESLRKGNIISLLVKFDKEEQISLIETEEHIDISKTQGKLVDYIMRNNYQEITYKTQNGQITHMRRKTKTKVMLQDKLE